jgi:hypothetical protein
MGMKRDYENNENNEINEKPSFQFSVFSFRLRQIIAETEN